MTPIRSLPAIVLLLAAPALAAPAVKTARLPGGGVQPQVAVDPATGTVHLVYLTGDPAAADVMYAKSADAGTTWSPAVRVNTRPGAAIAMGTVRGAQVAVGRGGRVHVAWNGSRTAEPKAPGGATPLLYARAGDDGRFEPERNLAVDHVGLDGGCSVAAAADGHVYVAWHAPTAPGAGEENRVLWVVESGDDGKTFAAERPLSTAKQGACGCCGTRVLSAAGRLWAVYRSAYGGRTKRDVRLATQAAAGEPTDVKLVEQQSAMCPMSTFAMAAGPAGVVAVYEGGDGLAWVMLDPKTGTVAGDPHPLAGRGAKHPSVAVAKDGTMLIAWAEGTGWNKGGTVRWAVIDPTGKQAAGGDGRAAGLPAWDLPAAIAKPDGSFVVLF
ncbi:MAG TPA: sialidase family protein [Humisphaera sp.]